MKTTNEMTMPCKYEVDRITLIIHSMYGLFDGTRESIGFLMHDVAMFYQVYEEAIEEARKHLAGGTEPTNEIIDGLMMVLLGFEGMDRLLSDGDDMVYNLAKSLLDQMDISKEYSDQMRQHVLTEMQLRSA